MLKLNELISCSLIALKTHLNTSHVKVKLYFLLYLQSFLHDLNTSHVKVKPADKLALMFMAG